MGTRLGRGPCLPWEMSRRIMASALSGGSFAMNVPKRQSDAPAEAEGEVQSLDVLALEPMPQGGAAGHPEASNSSIAPVGLDFLPMRGRSEEAVRPVREAAPPARRRHTGLAIGVVAGCALILLAAGIARVGHASSTPSPAVATPTDVAAPISEPLPTNATPSPAAAANALPA